MATVKLVNNIFENKAKNFFVDEGKTIESIIREYSKENEYEGTLIECYDVDTGETFYSLLEDDTDTLNAVVLVNRQSKGIDYAVQADDEICIVITPAGSIADAIANASQNQGTGMAIGGLLGGLLGLGLGILTGNPIALALLFFGAAFLGSYLGYEVGTAIDEKNKTYESGQQGKKQLGAYGATNQPMTNYPYPLVIGKHLATPMIIGSPYNEISGFRGQTNYTHVLYAVGYSPLRITDIKLGDMILAHNQKWNGSKDKRSVFHGKLSGIDEGLNNKGLDYFQRHLPLGLDSEIDLFNRTVKSGVALQNAGWTDVQSGETGTVYPKSYTDGHGNGVLVTPILQNGTVLTPSQTETYANQLLNGQTTSADIWLGEFSEDTESEVKEEMKKYAAELNSAQADFYGFNGDITNVWKNNDVEIEILQQGQNGQPVQYSENYPYAMIQNKVNSSLIYIASGDLSDIDESEEITYKGRGFSNGLRNQPIHFTEQYAKSATVTLDLPQGFYKTRSETSNNKSKPEYYSSYLCVAIQWRVYSVDNPSADAEKKGDDISIPTYHYAGGDHTHYYNKVSYSGQTGDFRGWNSFSTLNGQSTVTYNATRRDNEFTEFSNCSGNNLSHKENLNPDWIGAQVFSLHDFGAYNGNKEGLNEIRLVTKVDFVEWSKQNLLTAIEREDLEEGSASEKKAAEKILAEKMDDYFFGTFNTTKCIEVRVVRITPCYIDQTTSSGDTGAYSFNDVITWDTMASELLDSRKLKKGKVEQVRPISEDRMRKLCIISLKAKDDNTGQIGNTIKNLSCTAQSFSPYYDRLQNKFIPESVTCSTKYFGPLYESDGELVRDEITESAFIENRQTVKTAVSYPDGNNYASQIDAIVRTSAHRDDKLRYFLPYNDRELDGTYKPGCDGTLNFCDNNVASSFLLAAIGRHLGKDALGYEQSFYDNGTRKEEIGDFNMTAISRWYQWAESVSDGSKYPEAGFHFDKNGNKVEHDKGELAVMQFTANAYVTSTTTLENMLAQIAVAGRSVYTRDFKNRITIIIDKVEKFPAGLFNQQNIIKKQCALSYAELPSGLQMSFDDENDGYQQNLVYCMIDGEKSDNPNGAIEPYTLSFVTNNYQLYSLGRYVLANRIMNKEVVTIQTGIEGASFSLGDMVLVQDDTMLIGTDTGGRITQLLEDNNLIYGFIINNMYKYTGDEQGVIVMQPSKYKESKVVTIELAVPGTSQTIEGVTYTAVQGMTNTVLFKTPITKDDYVQDGSNIYIVKPEVDNIVGFGKIGKVTAKYRIVKIKPDSKRHYDFTLMKYQEELYEYGREFPVFQNNMTVPQRDKEYSFELSPEITKQYLDETINRSESVLSEKISTLYSNHIITLYKSVSGTGELTDTGITADLVYDFATNTATWGETGTNNGWSMDFPSSTSNQIWVTTATAFGQTAEDTIEPSEWSTPIRWGGKNGINTATIYLYQRSASQPQTKPATLTYNFTTGAITGTFNGWNTGISGDNRYPCWEIHATALSSDLTDDINTNEWSAPVKVFQDGGYQKYQFAISASADTYPTSDSEWHDTPPATTSQKPYLWMRTKWIDGGENV